MEARGLVERRECAEDGRGTWITLTADGRRATLCATREHAAKLREVFFDVLEDDEKEALRAGAARVLDRINPPACQVAEEVCADSALHEDAEAAV